jgi:phosphoribulokinase
VDALHVRGDAPREESRRVENVIWSSLVGEQGDAPGTLGTIGEDRRSEPLAITQLMLLYHLLDAVR